MARLLRIYLYADPSRRSYTQLHPDIEVDDMPTLRYGQPVRVGDQDDNDKWSSYIVASLLRMKQEEDEAGKNRIIYEVFVAKKTDWQEFEGLGDFQGSIKRPTSTK